MIDMEHLKRIRAAALWLYHVYHNTDDKALLSGARKKLFDTLAQGELKPCPFPCCEAKGSDLRVVGPDSLPGTSRWFVRCNGCEAEGPGKSSRADALEAWNAAPRRTDTSVDAGREALWKQRFRWMVAQVHENYACPPEPQDQRCNASEDEYTQEKCIVCWLAAAENVK